MHPAAEQIPAAGLGHKCDSHPRPPQCSVLSIEAHPTCRAAGRHHHPSTAAQLRLDSKHARDFIVRAEGQSILLDLQAVSFGSSAGLQNYMGMQGLHLNIRRARPAQQPPFP